VPLPAPVIQLNPPGFLDLLGLKSFGMNPPNIDMHVQPVFEMQDWYLRSKQETQIVSQVWATSAGGVNLPAFTVPNGEWWYVQRMSQLLLIKAGDLLLFWGPYMILHANTVAFFLDSPTSQTVIALDADRVCIVREKFWAPPGAQLGSYYRGTNTSGTSSTATSLLYTRVAV